MAGRRKILWSAPALADLREIREYVSRDKPSVARKLARAIQRGVLRLREHPRSGRIVPELQGRGYREVVVAPHRIVYEEQKNSIIILRVWHGRRGLGPTSLPDR